MLRFTVALCSIRKMALKLFRDEQLHSANLQGLSMAQKRKVIEKKFNHLGRNEMRVLRQRAREMHDNVVLAAGAGAGKGDFQPRHPKITAYELFFKEQSSNPSISSITSPRLREKRVFAIFQTLPEKTRKQLEERAEKLSQSGGQRKISPAVKVPKPKKEIQTKASKKAPTKRTAAKKKQKPSTYRAFVKEQMPLLKHLPPAERIKTIAKKWKAQKGEKKPTKRTGPSENKAGGKK